MIVNFAQQTLRLIREKIQHTILNLIELNFMKETNYSEEKIVGHMQHVILRGAEMVVAIGIVNDVEVMLIAIPTEIASKNIEARFNTNWRLFRDMLFPKNGNRKLERVSLKINNPKTSGKIVYKVVQI